MSKKRDYKKAGTSERKVSLRKIDQSVEQDLENDLENGTVLLSCKDEDDGSLRCRIVKTANEMTASSQESLQSCDCGEDEESDECTENPENVEEPVKRKISIYGRKPRRAGSATE